MLELIIPVLVIFLLMTKVICVSTIQSGSMEPTLNKGNIVFYNRLFKIADEQNVTRGDIICFFDPISNKHLSKRIIGVSGDRIGFSNGKVIINGFFLDESAYLSDNVMTYSSKSFEVPENSYFVLGDNRENSFDSRYWANPFVNKNQIEGIYIGKIDFSRNKK